MWNRHNPIEEMMTGKQQKSLFILYYEPSVFYWFHPLLFLHY